MDKGGQDLRRIQALRRSLEASGHEMKAEESPLPAPRSLPETHYALSNTHAPVSDT